MKISHNYDGLHCPIGLASLRFCNVSLIQLPSSKLMANSILAMVGESWVAPLSVIKVILSPNLQSHFYKVTFVFVIALFKKLFIVFSGFFFTFTEQFVAYCKL